MCLDNVNHFKQRTLRNCIDSAVTHTLGNLLCVRQVRNREGWEDSLVSGADLCCRNRVWPPRIHTRKLGMAEYAMAESETQDFGAWRPALQLQVQGWLCFKRQLEWLRKTSDADLWSTPPPDIHTHTHMHIHSHTHPHTVHIYRHTHTHAWGELGRKIFFVCLFFWDTVSLVALEPVLELSL